jgi:hypothetical protein
MQPALAQVSLAEARMLFEHHGGTLLWRPCWGMTS